MTTHVLNAFFGYDKWNIGIAHEQISCFLRPNARPNVRWLSYPCDDKYLADPFAAIRNGRIYVLCEEFDYRTDKGRIVTLELTQGLSSLAPEVVMELPVHMSYPYLFEYQGEIYCTPETYQAHEVGLYKADDFPYRWRKIAVMVSNFAGADNTVFKYNDRWWLTSVDEEARPHYKLFVWHASDPTGPWMPHAANPVKVDISSSRPAGTPFFYKGSLYRPAQDCSRTYGGRIVLNNNRIVTLTHSKFKEERASIIEPCSTGHCSDGLHTISAAGNNTIIDGKRRVFNKHAFKNELWDLLGLRQD